MPFVWLIGGAPEPHRPREAPSPSSVRPIPATEGPSPIRKISSDFTKKEKAYQKAGPRPPAEKRERAIQVKEIMTEPVETLPPNATIEKARQLFGDQKFHHVPIIDGSGRLVGLLSDRNLIRATENFVHEIMTRNVLTATPETPIREAAEIMVSENISCLPILDHAHRVIGILSRTDILRTVVNHAPLDLWT